MNPFPCLQKRKQSKSKKQRNLRCFLLPRLLQGLTCASSYANSCSFRGESTSRKRRRAPFSHGLFLEKLLRLFQIFAEILHDFRNLDLLRANSFATATTDACRRFLILGICQQRHGGDKPAAGEDMFVIKLDQRRNIQMLRTIGRAIPTSGTRLYLLVEHAFCDLLQNFPLLRGERLCRFESSDILF